jgi:thioester reductase-like protein
VASNIGLVDYQNAALDQQGRIPIGKALPGYHVCMVDEGNRPLPIGFVGQIAVSGSGVSAGYLEDAELTRAKFLSGTTLPSELSTDSKARWYLTGDIGRMEDDGRIIYMGRIDQDSQVKLRGIRIELMEISNSILQAANGAISQAVVGIRGEDINQFLVAYIVYTSTNKPEDPQEYLARLLAALPLPVYMRPSQGIALERLPMTNSGKLDMKALAAMTIPRKTPIQDGASQPLTPIQSKLRDIWLKVLGDNDIKIAKDSNFFSSGGNSLLVLKVQAEIRNTFAKDIKLPELFRIDTLEHLAQKIQGDAEAHGDGERSSNAIDWALETALPNFQSMPQTLTQKRPIAQRSNGQINVILTGATGFLGGAIARALQSQPQVQQIHCIAVRNPASAAAQSLLLDCPKLILYSGDLSQPRLGLGEDEARLLLADAAAVIHNGADVSFMKTYETLRDINVGSTQQLVQLCLEATGGPVPIHFVSTAGVGAVLVAEAVQKGQGASALQLKRKSLELHPPPRTSGLVDGYVASKWTSEVVLEKTSKATGLPVRVYRPSSITGVNAPDLDIVHNVIHLSRSMRAVPDMTGWGGWFDLVTVQTAAKMITDGVMETHAEVKELLKFVHVSGEQVVAVSDVKSLLESETGYAFRQLDMAAWLREATQHGMSPLVAAYLSTTSGDSAVLPWFPRIEST